MRMRWLICAPCRWTQGGNSTTTQLGGDGELAQEILPERENMGVVEGDDGVVDGVFGAGLDWGSGCLVSFPFGHFNLTFYP